MMTLIRPTDKAIALFKENKIQAGLTQIKRFKIGLTKDDQRFLQIAQELATKESFYKMIGTDVVSIRKNAARIINNKWLIPIGYVIDDTLTNVKSI